MNTELGRKVLAHVTARRDQFDMTVWGDRDPECGTVACLAGWAMLLSGYRLRDGEFVRPDGCEVESGTEGDEAALLLELSDAERYGSHGEECSLFGEWDEEEAIARFRKLVEASEAIPEPREVRAEEAG